jgi:hypothetical protein
MKSLKDLCHNNIAEQIISLPPSLQNIVIESTIHEIEKKCKENILKQINKDLSFILCDIVYKSIVCHIKGNIFKINRDKYRHLYSDDIINILEYISIELTNDLTFLIDNNIYVNNKFNIFNNDYLDNLYSDSDIDSSDIE